MPVYINTYTSVQQSTPISFNEVKHSIGCSVQGGSPDEQSDHDHVRKQGQKVGCLPRALHSSDGNQKRDEPRQQKEQ